VLQGVHKARNRLSVKNRTAMRKECVEKFLLKKSLGPNFVRDFEFARRVSESISGEIETHNQKEGRNMLKFMK
jgi:hypothetical protein